MALELLLKISPLVWVIVQEIIKKFTEEKTPATTAKFFSTNHSHNEILGVVSGN